MAAKDLGNKHTCFKCSAKFYDLKKPDPVCPKCGANQKDSPANRPAEARRSRLAPAKPVLPVEPVAGEPAEADDSDDEDEFEEAEIPDEDEEA